MNIKELAQAAGRCIRVVANALKEDLGSRRELWHAIVLMVASVAVLPIVKVLQMNTDQIAFVGLILFVGAIPLWLPPTLDLLTAVVLVDKRVPLQPWGLLSLGAILLWTVSFGFAHIVSPALVEAYTKMDATEFERAVTMISVWLTVSLGLFGIGFACALVSLATCFSYLFKSRSFSKMMATVATVALALSLMLLGIKMLEQETSTAFVGEELAMYNFSSGQSRCSNVKKTAMVHALPSSAVVIVWQKGEFAEVACQAAGTAAEAASSKPNVGHS